MKTLLVLAMLASSTPSYSMTYLDHLLRMNGVLCKALFHKDCQRPPNGPATEKQCKETFDKMSQMGPNNKKIKVTKAWSDKCINSVKQLPPTQCVETVAKSITGACKRK